MAGLPAYATVEQVARAADVKATANETARLRRITLSASRLIDNYCHRHFYPRIETRTYDVDSRDRHTLASLGAGIFLNADLLSLTSMTEDDDAVTVPGPELYSFDGSAPFSWIETSGSVVAITGVWGYTNDTEPAGALAEALDASETDVDVTNSAAIGIGDAIKCEDEWVLVTAKTMLDSAENLGANLDADASDVTVDLSDGTAFSAGETILIDSERMLITDISGNNGTVVRAYDGSVLAAHTATTDIYVPRTLTVERGALGTTAASHSDTTALVRNVPPQPITDLCIAESLNTFAQETAGYARTIGSGEGQREARGAGLADARKQAKSYRRMRMASV